MIVSWISPWYQTKSVTLTPCERVYVVKPYIKNSLYNVVGSDKQIKLNFKSIDNVLIIKSTNSMSNVLNKLNTDNNIFVVPTEKCK